MWAWLRNGLGRVTGGSFCVSDIDYDVYFCSSRNATNNFLEACTMASPNSLRMRGLNGRARLNSINLSAINHIVSYPCLYCTCTGPDHTHYSSPSGLVCLEVKDLTVKEDVKKAVWSAMSGMQYGNDEFFAGLVTDACREWAWPHCLLMIFIATL